MQTRQQGKDRHELKKRVSEEQNSKWIWPDEKSKWSVSGKCYRGGEEGESSDACLHPAMIRVQTGWCIFCLQNWVPGKKSTFLLNYWGVLFWKENMTVGIDVREQMWQSYS